MSPPLPFSIAILTRNEEINLPGCLESVAWADDVVVFDSCSSDATERLARGAGRAFYQHPFRDYADQRTRCLETVPFRHEWVFFLDADERFTPALRDEIAQALRDGAPGMALFRVRRRDLFMGRWIRRTSGYPTWFGRLVRRGQVTISRAINERYETGGGVALLQEHLLHFPFNRGFHHWFERHNTYSTMEAEALEAERAAPVPWRAWRSRDPQARRALLKAIAYRVPGRPLLAFLFLYVVRLGFLEGRAGFTYAWLRAIYESMIDLKRAERRRRAKGQPL